MMTKSLEGLLGKSINLKELDTLNNSDSSTITAIKTSNVWGKRGDIYFPIEETVKDIPPGFYSAKLTMSGPILVSMNFEMDEVLELPDSESEKILDGIQKFWKLKETFKELNFLHKRGVFLWSPPGVGKSVCCYRVGKSLIEDEGGVVLYPTDPWALSACIDAIRSIHKELKILIVLEDLDDMVAQCGDRKLTAILDGENKTDNIVFLATTNHPERLPARIINRPSRFDIVEEMKLPTAAARKMYLQHKATSLSEKQVDIWVEKTDGFSIPMLKELIISVLGFTYTLDDSIEKLKTMMNSRFTL